MFGFILGILVVVASIIVAVIFCKKSDTQYKTDSDGMTYVRDEAGHKIEETVYPLKKYSMYIILVGVILGLLFAFLGCIANVDTGHTGVVTVFGKVEDFTLDAGFHLKAPWQSVLEMDNRVQKAPIDLECFSSDIQEVTCKYTLNYQINKQNAQEIYKSVGKDYFDTVITPNVAEAVKTIMAHYTAENLVGKRDSLASEIETLLCESLSKYNIELVSTAIEDLDFTDEFTNAVEQKQVAVQNKLKATTEQEQKTMEAQQAAERAKIEAEAAAEVAKINADANAYAGLKEAEKNKAISESLTKDLIKYYWSSRWDGKLPSTMLGEDSSMILDIGE